MKYVLMAVLLVAGCTSFGVFDEKLPGYVGKPIDALVERIGYPNREQTIMGRKAYIWNTSEQYSSIVPTISTTTGYVGSTPISTQTTAFSSSTDTLSCSIRVFVDSTNRITRYEYNGNNGTCFRYASKL